MHGGIDAVQSRFISETLDHLGYNQETIGYRKCLIRRIRENVNEISPLNTKFLLFGSRAEGTSVFYESDCDCIVVNEHAICEADANNRDEDGSHIVYKCKAEENTPPGYFRLNLSPGSRQYLWKNNDFLNSTFDGYLYSSCYSRMMQSKRLTSNLMNGLTNFGNVKTDFPLVLYHADILTKLRNRMEIYGWPTKETIDRISWAKVTSYMYPIGAEQSDSPYLEWRVSHAAVEQVLMENMNDTQIKIYILLKMIVKPALARVFGISSYILKNVLFWVCQAVPEEHFRREQLVPCLVYAMEMLYNCVKNGHMPCFLLPERNLFPPLTVATKINWLHQLSVLCSERARMVLNNDKLRNIMMVKVMRPDVLTSYEQKREEIERLLLMVFKLQADTLAQRKSRDKFSLPEKESINVSDKLKEKIYDIVLPDWNARAETGEDVDAIVHTRLTQLLS